MTLAHAAYLFDLEGFRREFNVWRPDPDREDYVSFLTRAKVVLGEMPQVWDVLNRFRYNREDMKDYDESELGKLSTLVVLTQYLQQCPSIDYPTWEVLVRKKPGGRIRNWQIVEKGLEAIGWAERDARLLVEGISTDWLLQPELVITDLIGGLGPSEAWYSIGRTGWLDGQEIRRLLVKLDQSRGDFLRLDPPALPLYEEGHKPISEEQIELAFVCAWGMLKTAQVAGKGLFLAIVS